MVMFASEPDALYIKYYVVITNETFPCLLAMFHRRFAEYDSYVQVSEEN